LRISDFGFSRKKEWIVESEIRIPQFEILTMSEPEISHRCTSCGASIRGHALFCPQCGEPFARPTETSGQIVEGDPAPAADAQKSSTAVKTELAAPPPEAGPQRRRSDRSRDHYTPSPAKDQAAAGSADKPVTAAGTKSDGPTGSAAGRPATGDKTRKRIQRATTAARDALEDNVRPQVERIRHASTVVLEEASYDPSLRFILIAAALFVLFVVLLVISKVI
jgi:hypothetical protein